MPTLTDALAACITRLNDAARVLEAFYGQPPGDNAPAEVKELYNAILETEGDATLINEPAKPAWLVSRDPLEALSKLDLARARDAELFRIDDFLGPMHVTATRLRDRIHLRVRDEIVRRARMVLGEPR